MRKKYWIFAIIVSVILLITLIACSSSVKGKYTYANNENKCTIELGYFRKAKLTVTGKNPKTIKGRYTKKENGKYWLYLSTGLLGTTYTMHIDGDTLTLLYVDIESNGDLIFKKE